jgi:hypothetical protein
MSESGQSRQIDRPTTLAACPLRPESDRRHQNVIRRFVPIATERSAAKSTVIRSPRCCRLVS